MKDFYSIINVNNTLIYINENNKIHRLNGPAKELYDNNNIVEVYCINNIYYMIFYKNENKLFILSGITKSPIEHYFYIKQNINYIIKESNPEIKLGFYEKEKINNLPDFIKNIIII